MKVLFLDCDGVVNNNKTFEDHPNEMYPIDVACLDHVVSIVAETQAKIVLSSTWRLYNDGKSAIRQALKDRGLQIFDCTPVVKGIRAREIFRWLDGRQGRIERFAILDDDKDAGIKLERCFFQTDIKHGLTDEIAKRVILHLNSQSPIILRPEFHQ